jgi:5'-phosphate synthase pdxT subunit
MVWKWKEHPYEYQTLQLFYLYHRIVIDMDPQKIGVIGLQGDVEEHIHALWSAMKDLKIEGEAVWTRRPKDMEGLDGLVLPGGESTTISKLLTKFQLREYIMAMAEEGKPILGTCAGCVLLAKKGDELVERTKTELLGLMDISVDRNAFGPQRESFETKLDIEGLGDYPGVFIRAPMITEVWGEVEVLSRLDDGIVLARQGNLLAASFHPELTGDSSFYRLFFDMFNQHHH